MAANAPTAHIHIPGYRIRSEVGRGGVAAVYLAIQESLQREVALKVMSPALTTEPNFTDRFIQEGQTIAQLNHQGIVTIYDISVADYNHYIAMEYLPGGSLKDRLKNPLRPHDALNILQRIATALGYAHDKGIVHRDVKPENIMFRDQDEAVLTDFGIAKSGDRENELTGDGVIVGTPRYISPEQAAGYGTDPRSDIYALGVILYEMLTGRPLYQGKEAMAVLYSHVHDPIPELPTRYKQLTPLLHSMLAKEPGQRVPGCDQLLHLIDEISDAPGETTGINTFRSGTPTTEGGASAPGIASGGARGWGTLWSSLLWGGIAVAAVVVVVTVAGMLFEIEPEQTGRSHAGSASLLPSPTSGEPRIVPPLKVDASAEDGSVAAGPQDLGADTTQDSVVDAEESMPVRVETVTRDGPGWTFGSSQRTEPLQLESADQYLARAREEFNQNNYQQSLAHADSGLRVNPGHDGLQVFKRKVEQVMVAEEAYTYAEKLSRGRGIAQDSAGAIEWYRKAAAKGHPEAQHALGVAYANGTGVNQDQEEALLWLAKAAAGGNQDAQYNFGLGLLFGPKQDSVAAARLIKDLAQARYEPAFPVLGWMYSSGTGVRFSIIKSVKWGSKGALKHLAGVYPRPSRVVMPWQEELQGIFSDATEMRTETR